MNDQSNLIPGIFKSYVGKPKEDVGLALGFDGTEVVEWVSLEWIAWHSSTEGRLFIPGNWDMERWRQDRLAGDRGTARQRRYFVGSRLMIVDIDQGLPTGTPEETIAYLEQSSELIKDHAGAVYPSSSFSYTQPKIHILFELDELVTDWDEYMSLHARLRATLPFESDHATAKPTQPLYGTKKALDYLESCVGDGMEDGNILSVAWLRSLPETEPEKKERAAKQVRRERIERQGVRLNKSAKQGKRDVQRTLKLVQFILAEYPGKMPNDDVWYPFRLAAAAASGQSMRVFDAIANSSYWTRWGADWDVEFERNRWQSEAPHTVTAGTLYRMAHELGFGTINAAEIQPDFVIDSFSELPAHESYLLRAFTGAGKSEAQRATIEYTRAQGKKVCWIVPTKSLTRAAAADFRDFGAVIYLDDSGAIKAAADLRAAQFVITTPQTFARRIAPGGLEGYGLLVLDEVQQIANSVFDPTNSLWTDRKLNADFVDAIEAAKQQEGLILRGLDAGLAMQAQEWLGLPVYACTKTREKAPVTIYEDRGAQLETLITAVRGGRGDLICITADTKEVTELLADELRRKFPRCKMLLINADTVDERRKACDARALAFLNDPNAEVGKYDVIITSPTLLTGVSIVSRPAKYIFQFCQYLSPKSNLQMLNRVRAVTERVFVYMRGMGNIGEIETPEEAAERAEALLEGIAHLPRSEAAQRYEYLRWWGEVDLLYQSFDPVTYYGHLLRSEGREVIFDADSKAAYTLARDENDETHEWALDNYQNEPKYDATQTYRGVEDRRMTAMLMKSEVDRKTEGGWTYAQDKRRVALAAEAFKNHQLGLTEVASGARALSTRVDILASDPDTPPSLLKSDDKLIILLHALQILGYSGEETISAQTFVDYGREFVQFLSDNRRYWNAVFPRSKSMELSDDYVTDARALCKDLMSIIGLKMRRGNKTRILNPCNGARLYDAEIQNINELKHLLYLRACGRCRKELPTGIEIAFRELAIEAGSQADQEALAWFEAQSENVKASVRLQMQYGNLSLVKATLLIREVIEGGGFWE